MGRGLKIYELNDASGLTGDEYVATAVTDASAKRSTINNLKVTPTGSDTPRTLADWINILGVAPGINVASYGATGDGTTNDVTPFNDTYEVAIATDEDIHIRSGKTYAVNGRIADYDRGAANFVFDQNSWAIGYNNLFADYPIPRGRRSYTVPEPTITYHNIVAAGDASGLNYAHMPSQPVWFDDRWHVYWGGNTTASEAASGQNIYFSTLAGDTLADFTAPALLNATAACDNPISTTGYTLWQPAALATDDALWGVYVSRTGTYASTYLFKKTTGGGKHTNYRLLWDGDLLTISSTDLDGAPAGGLTRTREIDGGAYQFYPTGQGLVSSDGTLIFPGVMYLGTTIRWPVVLFSRDNGTTWRISGRAELLSETVNFWEPIVSETANGFVMVIRNAINNADQWNYYESFSADLVSWSEPTIADIYAHQQRASFTKLTAGIWGMAFGDNSVSRENGSLALSRDGRTYTPGLSITDDDGSTKFIHYPQVGWAPGKDYLLYVIARADIADSPEDIRIAKVAYQFRDDTLYVLPRRNAVVQVGSGHTAVLSGNVLTLNGQASAGIEHLGDRFAINLRYKLASSVSTDRFYIASVGDYTGAASIYVESDGSDAAVFVNGERVQKRYDETVYDDLEIVVDARKRTVCVFGREFKFGGNPVVLLGDGYLKGSLADSEAVIFDIANTYWRPGAVPPGLIVSPRLFELRNLIPNSDFTIAPGGTSATGITSDQYLPEFWTTTLSGATATVSIQAFTVGQNLVPGAPTNFLRLDSTVANDLTGWRCIVPDARTVAEVEAVFSVWVKAAAQRTYRFSFRHYTDYSAGTNSNVQQFDRSVGTEWTLVTIPFFMGGLDGASLDADDHLFAVAISNPTNETFTLDLAAPVLNYGYEPIQWRRPDPAAEELNALRYYETFGGAAYAMFCNAYAQSSTNVRGVLHYQNKRKTPAVSVSGTVEVSGINMGTYSSITPARIGLSRCDVDITTTGGTAGGVGVFRAGNDAAARVIVNARY